MSAIRVARGFTGRDLILKFEGCYHGHSDHLLVKAGSGLATFGQPSSAGVPESITSQTVVLPLDDEEKLETFFAKHGDKLAAAIIEGIPANNGLLIQRPDFMALLRHLTEKHGSLLILDEVITGFRLGLQGAAGFYDLTPDLLTFGKVIGGGMPVGAFGGRDEIMDQLSPAGPVYQAGTLSGNPVAMAGGLATLNKLAEPDFFVKLEQTTSAFCDNLQKRLEGRDASVINVGSIFWLAFQSEPPLSAATIETDGIAHFNRLHSTLLDRGLYFPPSGYEVCFISAAHTKADLSAAAQIIYEVVADSA